MSRRPRNKGMRRSQLKAYSAHITHAPKTANPTVLQEMKNRAKTIGSEVFPNRRQVQIDYLKDKTPAMTKPMAERTDTLHLYWLGRFHQGIDTYHSIEVYHGPYKWPGLHGTYMHNTIIRLFFHANHYFFTKEDLVTGKCYMSSDFNNKLRAMLCLHNNFLSWVQEIQVRKEQ